MRFSMPTSISRLIDPLDHLMDMNQRHAPTVAIMVQMHASWTINARINQFTNMRREGLWVGHLTFIVTRFHWLDSLSFTLEVHRRGFKNLTSFQRIMYDGRKGKLHGRGFLQDIMLVGKFNGIMSKATVRKVLKRRGVFQHEN
jgi:hypothetical protein